MHLQWHCIAKNFTISWLLCCPTSSRRIKRAGQQQRQQTASNQKRVSEGKLTPGTGSDGHESPMKSDQPETGRCMSRNKIQKDKLLCQRKIAHKTQQWCLKKKMEKLLIKQEIIKRRIEWTITGDTFWSRNYLFREWGSTEMGVKLGRMFTPHPAHIITELSNKICLLEF